MLKINKEISMSFTGIDPENKAKLTKVINEGVQTMSEIQDLREGLRDTVKALAEELQIKPNVINKAIRVAHKADWTQIQEDFDVLETILEATNRK
jgi:uncharacterized protein YpuA (DUF1002 family)